MSRARSSRNAGTRAVFWNRSCMLGMAGGRARRNPPQADFGCRFAPGCQLEQTSSYRTVTLTQSGSHDCWENSFASKKGGPQQPTRQPNPTYTHTALGTVTCRYNPACFPPPFAFPLTSRTVPLQSNPIPELPLCL
jgi:hypothetical protein